MKSYIEHMNDISSEELYDGLLGYGMFAEKLPPVFTSESFLKYCRDKKPSFEKKPSDFITYKVNRNNYLPRIMGIPTPMKYEILCSTLREYWEKLKVYFEENTVNHTYKISRIHVRKLYDKENNISTPKLFEMNYKNHHIDGNPESELLLDSTSLKASKYLVRADISTCFPSIYTHAIPWAIAGKETAKNTRNGNVWYNKIDKACQNCTYGETHGILIGPHASNLIAEIILTKIDKLLYNNGFRFIRNIDDYECYVDTADKGQMFIDALDHELRRYDLSINYKKTKIGKLPAALTDSWVHELNAANLISAKYNITTYTEINSYLDLAVSLTEEYQNASVLNYAIQVLSGLNKISKSGKKVAVERIFHLAIINPYLLHLMEKYVFVIYSVEPRDIQKFTQTIFNESIIKNNYEGISYALYFAVKYNFLIDGMSATKIIDTKDCISLVMAWLYYQRYVDIREIDQLKQEAIHLRNTDMDRYWIFVYEVLDESNLDKEWKTIKKGKVSFLRSLDNENTLEEQEDE